MSSSIGNKHLLKPSNVPSPSDCIEGQIRWNRRTTLERATLDMSIRRNNRPVPPLEVVGASLDREIGKANVKGVARRDRRRAYVGLTCATIRLLKEGYNDLPKY